MSKFPHQTFKNRNINDCKLIIELKKNKQKYIPVFLYNNRHAYKGVILLALYYKNKNKGGGWDIH